MVEVSTSLLSVKKEKVMKTIYNLETAKTDSFHIDVMDGDFVENDTTEQMLEYCDYLDNITNIPLDVHLMVSDVQKYIDLFLPYNPNIITIHYEAIKDKNELIDLLDYIKSNHCKAGISIKPNTDISEIFDILNYVHIVLIMTVEPGKSGQKLIDSTIDKISELKKYIRENNLETIIEADGGINLAGVDIVVSGTSIVDSDNYNEVMKSMKQ